MCRVHVFKLLCMIVEHACVEMFTRSYVRCNEKYPRKLLVVHEVGRVHLYEAGEVHLYEGTPM